VTKGGDRVRFVNRFGCEDHGRVVEVTGPQDVRDLVERGLVAVLSTRDVVHLVQAEYIVKVLP
jgi:hypothetical protein